MSTPSQLPPEYLALVAQATHQTLDFALQLGRPDIALSALMSVYFAIASGHPPIARQCAGFSSELTRKLEAIADAHERSLH